MCLRDIIDSLTEEQSEVLIILGKHCMSKNKNFAIQTIRKKVPPPFKNIDINQIIRELRQLQLIATYRKHNYRMTTKGFKVAQHLWLERRREVYSDLNF